MSGLLSSNSVVDDPLTRHTKELIEKAGVENQNPITVFRMAEEMNQKVTSCRAAGFTLANLVLSKDGNVIDPTERRIYMKHDAQYFDMADVLLYGAFVTMADMISVWNKAPSDANNLVVDQERDRLIRSMGTYDMPLDKHGKLVGSTNTVSSSDRRHRSMGSNK